MRAAVTKCRQCIAQFSCSNSPFLTLHNVAIAIALPPDYDRISATHFSARIVRLGRTMSFGRVTLSGAQDNKPVAIVSSAFAML